MMQAIIKPSSKFLVAVLLGLVALQLVHSAPMEAAEANEREVDDFDQDEPSELDDIGTPPANSRRQSEADSELNGGLTGGNNEFGSSSLQGGDSATGYPAGLAPAASAAYGRGEMGDSSLDGDEGADEDEGVDIDGATSNQPQMQQQFNAMSAAGAAGRRQGNENGRQNSAAAAAAAASEEQDSRSWANNEELRAELGDSIDGQDSNIDNAKVEMSPNDMATAAGHHHHHGHGVHGWLEMGAKTGKKGAFKWHDKHPVGGKGRR